MRKVIGIGETILDIIFRGTQPSVAVPGGSAFNGIVSLGRLGADVTFISETGNDQVGHIILGFMRENNISTEYVNVFPNGKSPVSLAFLNNNNDADYVFYKDYPQQRLDLTLPNIEENDILVFGSYFALNPVLREKVVDLLEFAKEKKAIIYYDLNFRNTHIDEAMKLASTIIENLEYADIVRGSVTDCVNMFKLEDVHQVYKQKIKFYCPNFICTNGPGNISLRTLQLSEDYPSKKIEPVSTIGSGDNFNAGIIYGLLKYNVSRDDLNDLSESLWRKIIQCGIDLASEVCLDYSNSISVEYARRYS